MQKSVEPSIIDGTVNAPASKSYMQRALASALLTREEVSLTHTTFCDDSNAALRIIRALGASVDLQKNGICIRGGMKPTGEILDCGESGLSIRMFSSIAALWHDELVLTGTGSLSKRPMEMIVEPLRELSVWATTNNGFLPVRVKGPLKGKEITIDGAISSQFLTGLLMALPLADGNSIIHVNNLISIPYIKMTLSLLKDFGIHIEHDEFKTFVINGNQEYHLNNTQYPIEGDWSGAAFLLVAGAIGGNVKVTGLNANSLQADRAILEVLIQSGAIIQVSEEGIGIKKGILRAFTFDATHCPDLFPPLAVLACSCSGRSKIYGIERLIHKESNRATAICDLISSLGGEIRINDDKMEIEGKKLNGGIVDSHNDHRIAMAAATAAIASKGGITIRDYHCVNKSYPDFFGDLERIGGKVYE